MARRVRGEGGGVREVVQSAIWSDEATQGGATPYWLYCIAEAGEEVTGPCKIGIATHLSKRLSSLQGGNRRPLNLVWQIRLADREQALGAEEYCLSRFRPSPYGPEPPVRLCSEWVKAAPAKVLEVAAYWLDANETAIEEVA